MFKLVNKNNIQKIVDEFFSADDTITYYSEPRLYTAERKLFMKYLKNKGKLLDLCCGAGRTSIPLAKMGFDVVGVDKNLKMIETANRLKKKFNIRNVKFFCADASVKRFKKRYFDYAIVMENSLEHIISKEKINKIFKNTFKSLNKDGILIISFHSCFYPLKIPLKLFFHNVEYLLKTILLDSSQKLDLNEIVMYRKEIGKPLFFHYFSFFEIKKMLKSVGFKSFKIISLNELYSKDNKFKNSEIYRHIRPFLYCYWIFYK